VSLNKEDNQVRQVLEKYKAREQKGFAKYGTNTDREDLTLEEWLNHLQEELMDATIYIQKLKNEIK